MVYFPHLLVHPEFQRKGVGRALMSKLLTEYNDFHPLMLTADGEAMPFYKSVGFAKAGGTEAMWIYSGTEH